MTLRKAIEGNPRHARARDIGRDDEFRLWSSMVSRAPYEIRRSRRTTVRPVENDYDTVQEKNHQQDEEIPPGRSAWVEKRRQSSLPKGKGPDG